MKQAVFVGPGRVVLRETPEPVRGDGQVLVAVGSCGICTWEQRAFKGTRREYPLLGGHEVGGVVVEGPARCDLSPGDVVAVSLVPRCGRCRYCRRGEDNLCAYVHRREAPADGASGPGGLAEVLAVPRDHVYPVAPELDCAHAALVEPIACVLRSLDRGGCQEGDTIAVFGLGFMGQLHAMCAAQRGCRTVGVATDHRPPPRAAVDQLVEYRNGSIPVVDLAEATDGQGVDVAFCIRGGVSSLEAAFRIVRPGGRIILFQSLGAQHPLTMDAGQLRAREVFVGGSLSHTSETFSAAARLVAERRLELTPLIGRDFALDRVEEALRHAIDNPGARTMVRPVSFGYEHGPGPSTADVACADHEEAG